jgi:hypothetical protein
VWVQTKSVDQDRSKGSWVNVVLEIGNERQVVLIAKQDKRAWSVERLGMRVVQARSWNRQQVATCRIPGVGRVYRESRRAHGAHLRS